MSVSVSEAARRLKRGPYYLKGVITGMGIAGQPITLKECGSALVMSDEDFKRLAKALKADARHTRKRQTMRPNAA